MKENKVGGWVGGKATQQALLASRLKGTATGCSSFQQQTSPLPPGARTLKICVEITVSNSPLW